MYKVVFDQQMALAELEKLRIIVAHHLRQIRLANDLETAKTFATLLGKTASDASYTVKEIRKEKKMKKITITTIMILGMTLAIFAMQPAYHTGNSRQFISVTGRLGVSCEYRMLDGQKIWRNFAGGVCPTSIEIY